MPDRTAPIGIATLHYGYNEGAILQAYALARLLEQRLGRPVEIVDQRYPEKAAVYGEPQSRRESGLREAIDNWLPLGKVRLRTGDSSAAFEHIAHHYSSLVVGSDVVWDLRYRLRLRRIFPSGLLRTQSDPFFPPFPNIYWPPPSFPIPTFAYAASVGQLDWRTVPNRHRREMARILEGLSVVSVRDERTLQFVEWVSPEVAARAMLVPDPTLVYDLVDPQRAPALRERLEELGVDFTRPRVGLVSLPSPVVSECANRLRAQGYQVVGISAANDCSDVKLFEEAFHPLDWVLLFGLMTVNLVERMHAAIFCIRNNAPFVAIDTYATDFANDSKTRSLLRRYGVERYCLPKPSLQVSEVLDRIDERVRGREPITFASSLAADQSRADEFFRKAAEALPR